MLAATGNFLLFFAGDIVQPDPHRPPAHGAPGEGVLPPAPDESEPRHRCRVCGKTDLSDPQLDFRYCSKCAGNQCYCPEHIFNHEHVLVDEDVRNSERKR